VPVGSLFQTECLLCVLSQRALRYCIIIHFRKKKDFDETGIGCLHKSLSNETHIALNLLKKYIIYF
jgi:hypothetical protein